jgi:hypothetical protein
MRHAMTCAVLVALVGATTLPAQGPGLSDDRLGTRAAPLLLLTRADVRADLGLSSEQSAAADAAIRELYSRAQALRGQGNTPQVIAARKAIDEAGRDWIATHLSVEQQARLMQIDLQWEGPAALVTRGSLAASLGLTAEQSRALRTAVDERRRAGPNAPDAERRLAETTLALLTPEQRDRWKAMLGRPFAMQATGAPPAATR